MVEIATRLDYGWTVSTALLILLHPWRIGGGPGGGQINVSRRIGIIFSPWRLVICGVVGICVIFSPRWLIGSGALIVTVVFHPWWLVAYTFSIFISPR